MARKGRGPQSIRDRRGGARPGAGRKPARTEDQMIIIGGKCQELWKAAAKRRAKERQEAKIDDLDTIRSLNSKALSVARGYAKRDRGLAELKRAVECGEVSASVAAEISATPDVREREIRASLIVRLAPISHDIDVEMEEHGGRYQSLPLKRPKNQRERIIDEVVAWARERYGSAISARRVEESWDRQHVCDGKLTFTQHKGRNRKPKRG